MVFIYPNYIAKLLLHVDLVNQMLYNLNLVFTSHHIGTISDLKSPVPRLRNACWYLTAIDSSALSS